MLLIALTIYDVSIDVSMSVNTNSNGPSINIFYKNFNVCYYNSSIEIYIENYEIVRFGRNWHGGGVASYIRSDISYKLKYFLPNEIENSTFDILMLHMKPITII